MLTRRRAVQALAMGLGAAATGWKTAWAGQPPEGARIRFGAQTNAWKIDPNSFASLLDVLQQVRSIGYQGFETGFLNVREQFGNAEAARARIESTGLTFFGIHIFLPAERYDQASGIPPASIYEPVARGGAALGARHMIFSASTAEDEAQLQRKIAGLNAAGRFSRSAGIPLAYHNEKSDEFGSKIHEIEAIYEQTDPRYVWFVLDCGHAYQGGADVPAFLRRHHRRIVGLHLRDYRDGQQVPLGQGTFPLAEVARTLKELQWKGWVLNEEERLDGTKAGTRFMKPAFEAAEGAFRS